METQSKTEDIFLPGADLPQLSCVVQQEAAPSFEASQLTARL